ncbi:DUF2279 domain-containing protein [Runella sp. SP2]|uniref:DUF2279 domain-containing protein n=1 Tax=Runella sp. SP2 TaxID=2268026 RepID=UPI000F081376|nr:DUF2279 domain-containing protein [Runella sp. SP2]AYQ30694.1 DUF2279 domain-containing protein [Runella sp. SP2]
MKSRLFLFLVVAINGLGFSQTDSTHEKEMPTFHKGRFATVVATEAALYAGTMAYLNFIWYKDTPRVPFGFYNDAAGYLQVDKFGHAYGAYLESYIGYKALRWTGASKKKALLFGGTLGFFLQSPIEIIDGFYEGWGFSWSDMAANAVGSSLVIGQELLFDEQIMKYKFSFRRSPYSKQANGYLGTTFAGQILQDYNAHTYWFSIGLNRIIRSERIPDWLNVAVGYGANGMFGEFENIKRWGNVVIPPTQRYRQFLFSLDIDWTKIKTKNRFLNQVFQSMFMVKLPFPALEINTKGGLRAYGIYY